MTARIKETTAMNNQFVGFEFNSALDAVEELAFPEGSTLDPEPVEVEGSWLHLLSLVTSVSQNTLSE